MRYLKTIVGLKDGRSGPGRAVGEEKWREESEMAGEDVATSMRLLKTYGIDRLDARGAEQVPMGADLMELD